MTTSIQETALTQKTIELCQAILDSSEFQAMRKDIETFLANDKVRGEYDTLVSKGQGLQQKQQSGIPLQADEIEEFEKSREAFISNPVAQGFLDAQEGIEAMQKTVKKYVAKTFELGRIPEENELAGGGGCGSGGGGCGCH
jgi:cell fate (sporulation/competence/biofilm development) regulator YlbF (YheA/YmcA/DUF963 family)